MTDERRTRRSLRDLWIRKVEKLLLMKLFQPKIPTMTPDDISKIIQITKDDEKLLGKGAYGEVYGPCEWRKKKSLAVKRIAFNSTSISDNKPNKLEKKKELWALLSHENLLKIFHVQLTRSILYILMEYAGGGSVRKVLDLNGPLPSEVVKDWAKQIADGMFYLHTRNKPIVHRDLKSGNILLTQDFDPHRPDTKIILKIADFDEMREHHDTVTMTFVGTLGWMAPEVLQSKFSKSSDVWSYGVVVWEMLTGKIPHDKTSLDELTRRAKLQELALPMPESADSSLSRLLNYCFRRDGLPPPAPEPRPSFEHCIKLLECPFDEALGENDISLQRNKNKRIYLKVDGKIYCAILSSLENNEFDTTDPDFILMDWDGNMEKDNQEIGEINELPLELLHIILLKCFLFGISGAKQPDQFHEKDFLLQLASVHHWWFKAMLGLSKKFKKRVWKHASDFYRKDRKQMAIYRNNRLFLEESIQLRSLIQQLKGDECLTDAEARLLNRHKLGSRVGKPHPSGKRATSEFIDFARAHDASWNSKFIRRLRQNEQKDIATLLENGGVVIKADMKSRDTEKMLKKFESTLENLRNITKSKIHVSQADAQIGQLKINGIEIFGASLERQIAVWIWCKSPSAFEKLKILNESGGINAIGDVERQTGSRHVEMAKISAAAYQLFEKDVVAVSTFPTFVARLPAKGRVTGIAKLRSKIHVLCEVYLGCVIHVFSGRYPHNEENKFRIEKITSPKDLVANEKENCLYISDASKKCIWKITVTAGECKITEWLRVEFDEPFTMSMSNEDQLLILNSNGEKPSLNIYEEDAELRKSVPLPADIERPSHAVETSKGNFVIAHSMLVTDGNQRMVRYAISEVNEDGKRIDSCFISGGEGYQEKKLYLATDYDDRVIMADYLKKRVILRESDLYCFRIFPTCEKDEDVLSGPVRIFYDKKEKQLIVGVRSGGVNVYTLESKYMKEDRSWYITEHLF